MTENGARRAERRDAARDAARGEERRIAVTAAVADIRAIERDCGVTSDGLARIRRRLLDLAGRVDLFPETDFPPPEGEAEFPANIYRIAEDGDHRFALYVQSARGPLDTPPHNHTTWAVIAGIRGDELNRFWQRTADGGAAETGRHVVRRGTAVAFLPDDLHSIHVARGERVINFHMYGLALDRLHAREYYRALDNSWRNFPAQQDIIDARNG